MLILPLVFLLVTQQPLSTISENSKWTKTGRYEEVEKLCEGFARAHPQLVKCETFGKTPEGRPMLMLVASKAADRPVIFFQGGIHAGEIDGKDAGFWALRDVLENKAAPGILDKATIVFVPVFNVDGHERFGRNNRPNQRGPEETGWRTTAHNLNLNRDYMKADAPEMSAMLGLLRAKDPLLYVDLHATDGAQFEHGIAVMVDPVQAGPKEMREAGRKLQDGLMKKLAAHLPLPFYPAFNEEDDPASGFSLGIAPPRFSVAYWSIQNRFGILVETHSWRTYPERVRSTRDTIISILELATKDIGEWHKAARAADEAMKKLGGTNVDLAWETTKKSRTIDFRGYEYRRVPSPISGAMMVAYDETKPETWKVPLFEELQPALTVRAPKVGYLIPAAEAGWLAPKLKEHGIELKVLEKGAPARAVEVFRASEVVFGTKSYEGRQTVTVKGAWVAEKRDLTAGSLFVPIAQKRARVLLHLFEPASRDSYVSWGFFNRWFEQKEYVEAYVLETFAVELMAKDAAVKAEFEKKLATDAAFRQNAEQRLDFFYRRHPAFDTAENAIPLYRLEQPWQ